MDLKISDVIVCEIIAQDRHTVYHVCIGKQVCTQVCTQY